MFVEERPSLLPLPLEPFRYYQYGERTVHMDGCVDLEAAYSVPAGWIGKLVNVQWDTLHIPFSIPKRTSCYASMSGKNVVGIVSVLKTIPSRRHGRQRSCWRARVAQER
jgi:hypothetical protein